jgi:hypothetical protein
VIGGTTSGNDQAATTERLAKYQEAGTTWWIEDLGPWQFEGGGNGISVLDQMYARIRQGPPDV